MKKKRFSNDDARDRECHSIKDVFICSADTSASGYHTNEPWGRP